MKRISAAGMARLLTFTLLLCLIVGSLGLTFPLPATAQVDDLQIDPGDSQDIITIQKDSVINNGDGSITADLTIENKKAIFLNLDFEVHGTVSGNYTDWYHLLLYPRGKMQLVLKFQPSSSIVVKLSKLGTVQKPWALIEDINQTVALLTGGGFFTQDPVEAAADIVSTLGQIIDPTSFDTSEVINWALLGESDRALDALFSLGAQHPEIIYNALALHLSSPPPLQTISAVFAAPAIISQLGKIRDFVVDFIYTQPSAQAVIFRDTEPGITLTPQPPFPTPSSANDAATFIADVTIPDGTNVQPGQPLVKTWRIRNDGNTTWNSGYSLAFIGGQQLGAPGSIYLTAPVSPGQEVELTANMTSPTSGGSYSSVWQMRNSSNTLFGDAIWLFINVTGSTIATATPGNPTNGIELCDGSNFGYPCQLYSYSSDQTCINLTGTTMNNRADSLKFLGNYVGKFEAILYDDTACSVYNARYGSDATDLGGLNNQISSIRIEQLQPADCSTSSDGVTLYVNGGYQGHCHTFAPGSYGDLGQYGLDQNITSIKDPGGAFAVHLNDGLNFSGQPGNFDQDVYDLGANGWGDRARSVQIERHIPSSCTPLADAVVLYVDANYGAGCLSVTESIPDLGPSGFSGAFTSVKFLGSYQGHTKLEIYSQANYAGLCNSYWQDQSDLRECTDKAVSVKLVPYDAPTPIPTQPGDLYTGNIAPLGYRDRAGSDAVVDGNSSTEWIGGHMTSIGFSWGQAVTIHHIIVWDRAQSSTDNNQINSLNLGFSDGTSILGIDMTSGGPRCADVTFPDKAVTWVNVIPADASGNNGYREVEIWATTGQQYSNNSCVMKYNLTPTGGGLQPPVITATPAAGPTPYPINTPLPADSLFGTGTDGDLVVPYMSYPTDGIKAAILGDAGSGQTAVSASGATMFTPGSEVLLAQMQGANAGDYEFARVAASSGTTITLQEPLLHTYSSSGSNRAQVIRVPQYNNLTVPTGTSLTASAWDGTVGGVLAFRVYGDLVLQGSISANYLGYRGAPRNNWLSGAQGEGQYGSGGISCNSNGMGAGGGGSNGYGNPPGGGGGGYSAQGQYGKPGLNNGGACVGAGGNVYGSPALADLYLGGGGGAGGAKTPDGAAYYGGGGGNGGGAILIFARTLSGSGTISADGHDGYLGGGGGTGSNGGGGAGGSVFIASQSISIATISARKGLGGQYAPNHEQNGGDGADGRIRVEYAYAFTATTVPTADEAQLLYLANTPTPMPSPTATASATPTPPATATPTATATETCVVTSSAWLGEYWNNEMLSGSPDKCRYSDDLNYEWYSGSPVQGIAPDHFSARWTKNVTFEGGPYRFQIFHDDGARLYIDSVLVNGLGNWCETCRTTNQGAVFIQPGEHQVKLEMVENTGWASVQLAWEKLPILTASFLSSGTRDGWVLESGELTGQGGSMNAIATTFNVGEEAGDQQYRGILAFNTSSLPDTAVITRATLKIKRQGVIGTNPFGTHGNLVVDIREPAFGLPGLQLTDFQARPNKGGAGIFGKTPASGWYSASLSNLALPFINPTGGTQFRLRFSRDDNDDNSSDYLRFFSGNALAAYRPQLILEYYVP